MPDNINDYIEPQAFNGWNDRDAYIDHEHTVQPEVQLPLDTILVPASPYQDIKIYSDYKFGTYDKTLIPPDSEIAKTVGPTGLVLDTYDAYYFESSNVYMNPETGEYYRCYTTTVYYEHTESMGTGFSPGYTTYNDPTSPFSEHMQIPGSTYSVSVEEFTLITPLTPEEVVKLQELKNKAYDEGFVLQEDGTWVSPTDSCFPAGTLITLADESQKLIEDVVVGDMVMSFGVDGVLRPAPVTQLLDNVTDTWLKLSNGTVVTPGHRFLRPDGSFMEIKDIIAGDGQIVAEDGSIMTVTAEVIHYSADTAHMFETAEKLAYGTSGSEALAPQMVEGWRTYNFTVGGTHTYIADGIRVHNDSILSTLEEGDVLVSLKDDLDDAAVLRDVDGDGVDELVFLDGTHIGDFLVGYNEIVTKAPAGVTDVAGYLPEADPGKTYDGMDDVQGDTITVNGVTYQVDVYGNPLDPGLGNEPGDGITSDDLYELATDDAGFTFEDSRYVLKLNGLVDIETLWVETNPLTGEVTFNFNTTDGESHTETVSDVGYGGVTTAAGAFIAFTDLPTEPPVTNIDPVATDDVFSIFIDEVSVFSADDLMGNDEDADGDALALVSVQDAVNGSVELDDGGNVVFTPDEGFEGEANFSYTVSDGNGGEDSATVTITIAGDAIFQGTEESDVIGIGSTDADGDVISATDGNVVEAGSGFDAVTTGAGNDTIDAGAQYDTISSGDGDDVVHGGTGRDEVLLGDGNDIYTDELQTGYHGGDNIDGGAGNDNISTGGGKDTIIGGEGNDSIDAGTDYDVIDAGRGDDIVHGGRGRDTVDLGHGNDVYTDDAQGGFHGADSVYGGAGEDNISTGGGDDIIDGGTQADIIDAGSGNDFVHGGRGRDTVDLGHGNDVYTDDAQGGYWGEDVVDGGAGNDQINAGGGNDILTGGDGEDVFIFTKGAGRDVITDFDVNEDQIQLNGLVGFDSFEDVLAAAQDSEDGSSVVIQTARGSSIEIEGLTMADLSVDHFDFV